MTTVSQVNGSWFAYCDDRVLGPFKSEATAWRVARQHEFEVAAVNKK